MCMCMCEYVIVYVHECVCFCASVCVCVCECVNYLPQHAFGTLFILAYSNQTHTQQLACLSLVVQCETKENIHKMR